LFLDALERIGLISPFSATRLINFGVTTATRSRLMPARRLSPAGRGAWMPWFFEAQEYRAIAAVRPVS
jgi:hypothetical protein